MTGRQPQLLAASLVVVCASLFASSALAAKPKPKHHGTSSGCVSAVCVYHEQVPTATGSVSNGSGKSPPIKLSKKVDRALAKHGGKDAHVLKDLATNPGLGAVRLRIPESSGVIAAPGLLGAALDLGAGPITLFAALLAAAMLMAGRLALRRRTRTSGPRTL